MEAAAETTVRVVKTDKEVKDVVKVGRRESGICYLGPFRPERKAHSPDLFTCAATESQPPKSYLEFSSFKRGLFIIKPKQEEGLVAGGSYNLHLTSKEGGWRAELQEVRRGQKGFERFLIYDPGQADFREASSQELEKRKWQGMYCQPVAGGLALLETAEAKNDKIVGALAKEVQELLVSQTEGFQRRLGPSYRNP